MILLETYLKDNNLLYGFLNHFKEGSLSFGESGNQTYISCSIECDECILDNNSCDLSAIGNEMVSVSEYNSHFLKLYHDALDSNPEEFV